MAKRPESDYVESVRMHRQAELDDEVAELRAERDRYRAALEFYADAENYPPRAGIVDKLNILNGRQVVSDQGKRACAALEGGDDAKN